MRSSRSLCIAIDPGCTAIHSGRATSLSTSGSNVQPAADAPRPVDKSTAGDFKRPTSRQPARGPADTPAMVTAARAPYRILRGDRARPLLPHRQLAPLRDMLLSMAEMARVAASQLDEDARWVEAADALDAAAEALRLVAR